MKSIHRNILPEGGEAFYFGQVLTKAEADNYFDRLLSSVDWEQDEVIIFGKRIVTKRMTAWYGQEAFEYTYSRITRRARIWTEEIKTLKELVEKKTGHTFNACLLNLYHSGEEGMSWHSDAEAELGKNPVIASLSLGAARKFLLKHKTTKGKVSIMLEHGSLLLMAGATQKHWLHTLPKTKKVHQPRINLTFRRIKFKK